MDWEERLKEGLIQHVPFHMQDGVMRYIMQGIPGGSFLHAALTNNLTRAVGQADHINQARLVDWAHFLHNYMPSPAWGSQEEVEAWIERGGLEGHEK